MIIAIDGPAASGKGTLAKKLAARYGLRHLDTGSLYRAVAYDVLEAGGDPANVDDAVLAARKLEPSGIPVDALRTPAVSEAASVVAAIPEVRSAILAFQRDYAAQPPGAVLDGRDIGTVVCPNADAKLFVIASSQARARRRYLELAARDSSVREEDVLTDIEARDRRDRERTVSPMTKADDAYLLDTTNLDIETAFEAAVAIIDGRRSND